MSNYLFALGNKKKIDLLGKKLTNSNEVTITEISSGVFILIVEKIGETVVPGPENATNFDFYSKGFAINHELEAIAFGKCGFKEMFERTADSNIQTSYDSLEGVFTLAFWDTKKAVIKTDLYCMSTLLYFHDRDILVVSDSLYMLTEMRKALNLACIIDRDVAASKAWVYSLGHSPLCTDLIIKGTNILIPGQYLIFDFDTLQTHIDSINFKKFFDQNYESYETGLVQCYHRMKSVIESFADWDEFNLQFGLSGGIDSRLILAICLSSEKIMNSVAVKTNSHTSRAVDYNVVKFLSDKYHFNLNQKDDVNVFKSKHEIKLNSVTDQMGWWVLSNLGLYDMLYLPKSYWNHPAFADLGGHGGEIVKGKYLWRNANHLFNNLKFPIKEPVSKQITKGVKSLGFTPSDRESLQYHHFSYTCAVHNSRFISRTGVALRPLLSKDLFSLSKSSIYPHKNKNKYDYSIIQDLLIMINPELAAETFDSVKKNISSDYINEQTNKFADKSLMGNNIYEKYGSVTNIVNGPPNTFLQAVKKLNLSNKTVVENLSDMTKKAWSYIKNDPIKIYYEMHYKEAISNFSDPNSYVADVGISASKLSSFILGDFNG